MILVKILVGIGVVVSWEYNCAVASNKRRAKKKRNFWKESWRLIIRQRIAERPKRGAQGLSWGVSLLTVSRVSLPRSRHPRGNSDSKTDLLQRGRTSKNGVRRSHSRCTDLG